MAFSNPHVRGITYWDITDYDTWMGAPRGLIKADMTPKLAFYYLKDLIKTQWWTSLYRTTNSAGSASFSGFAGEYEVAVRIDDQTVKTETATLVTTGSNWVISI
jgi:hypothetical protein